MQNARPNTLHDTVELRKSGLLFSVAYVCEFHGWILGEFKKNWMRNSVRGVRACAQCAAAATALNKR